MPAKKQTGTDNIKLMNVTYSEPMMNGQKPNSLFTGDHLVEKINSPRECSSKIGIDLMYRPIPIMKGTSRIKTNDIVIQVLETYSVSLLFTCMIYYSNDFKYSSIFSCFSST